MESINVKYLSNLKGVTGKIVQGPQRLKRIIEIFLSRGREGIDADETKARGDT